MINMSEPVACVLGGSGFLGRRITDKLLSQGRAVVVADVRPSEGHGPLWRHADVRDVNSLVAALEGVDVVYNVAAEWRDDVRPASRYYETNVDGARNLCAAMEKQGIERHIFASSVSVYPYLEEVMTEETPLAPENDYGHSKAQAEEIFRAWASVNTRRTLVMLRPTVIFGEGNRGNVYNLVSQVASGRFAMIGSGQNSKSISYVENVAEAFCFCERLDAGIYLFNVSDQPDYTMNELIPKLAGLLGRKVPGVRLPYPVAYGLGLMGDLAAVVCRVNTRLRSVRVRKFCANTRYSSARLRSLGYTQRVTLDDALARVIASDFRTRGVR
jgi:nucleoside-diphosphate-sugar epimerase